MEGLKVRKILYTLIGTAIGVGIDVVLYFAAEILNSMTCGLVYDLCDCNGAMSTGSIIFFVLVIIASALVGLISGISTDAEKAAAVRAAYQRKIQEAIDKASILLNNIKESCCKMEI